MYQSQIKTQEIVKRENQYEKAIVDQKIEKEKEQLQQMKQYHQKLISEKEEELQDLKDKIHQEDRDMQFITSSLDIKSVD